MPCYYLSVSEVEIKDFEVLKKALGRLGYGDTYEQTGLIQAGPHTIKLDGRKATITSTRDYSFPGRLKQAYGVEAAKKEMRKRGMKFKEIQEGNKVRLVVQG